MWRWWWRGGDQRGGFIDRVWWRGCQRDQSDGFLDWRGGMVVGEIGGGFFFFFFFFLWFLQWVSLGGCRCGFHLRLSVWVLSLPNPWQSRGGSVSSLSDLFFKPIFFRSKTHAHEHCHQSHPCADPLNSVYVWSDGSGSDYFWVIWGICCFVLGFFFSFEKNLSWVLGG